MGPEAPVHPFFQAANREPQPRREFVTIQEFFFFFLLRAAPGELSKRGCQFYPLQFYTFQFSPSLWDRNLAFQGTAEPKPSEFVQSFLLSLIPVVDSPVSNEKGVCSSSGCPLGAVLEEGELPAGSPCSQKRAKNGISSRVWAARGTPVTDRMQAGNLHVVYAISVFVAPRYFRWNGDTSGCLYFPGSQGSRDIMAI